MAESEIHRRIKFAIAKELVDMGYMAGVEVQRPEGGILDVQGKKGKETVNIEVWKTHLPDWLIVRVKEVIEPTLQEQREVIVEVTEKQPFFNTFMETSIKNRECVNCGSKDGLKKYHIDGDINNNAIGNLELRCPSCWNLDLSAIHELPNKPHNEISKLKLFMEIFNKLEGSDKNDVEENKLIIELSENNFSYSEAKTFIKKAMQNGQIYQPKEGWYRKA